MNSSRWVLAEYHDMSLYDLPATGLEPAPYGGHPNLAGSTDRPE